MAETTSAAMGDLWSSRFALLNLILKDFRVRYRNMSLGVLWSVLNPLVILGVLSFVFTHFFPNDEKYFGVFILLGLVPYNFFVLCLSAATTSVVDNAPLVKKVVFPRMIIPISVVLSQLIHVAIQFLLLIAFILFFSVPVTPRILWLPVLYGIEFVFIVGLSLLCSSLCVFYRDVRYVVESGLSVLFWLTPIFYSLGLTHAHVPRWVYAAYLCNPLAGCIEGARRAVLYNVGPDALSLAMAAGVSMAALLIGFTVFSRLQRNFADSI